VAHYDKMIKVKNPATSLQCRLHITWHIEVFSMHNGKKGTSCGFAAKNSILHGMCQLRVCECHVSIFLVSIVKRHLWTPLRSYKYNFAQYARLLCRTEFEDIHSWGSHNFPFCIEISNKDPFMYHRQCEASAD
jgi:hypothetical protein